LVQNSADRLTVVSVFTPILADLVKYN
jgi:hypothetical protein